MNVLREERRRSSASIAFLAHGTTRRDQRADRAQGREDRADHDRGLPRLARDRARQPARLLQPRTTRSQPPFVPRYLRREVPGPHRARRARARAARPRRAAGDRRRTSAPTASRRSRSACSTPTPNPRHEQAVLARGARALARGLGRRLAPDHARVARVRAHQHGRPVGLRAAGRRALPRRGSPTASASAGFGGQLYIMQSNCGVDSVEKTQRDPDHDGRVGPGERRSGAPPSSAG